MSASARPATARTEPRGRPFINGNGGRPRGPKNRSTLVLAALSEGEKNALLRKGLELALRGDVTMLKFFLDRMLPRDRLITIELPDMLSAEDGVEALDRILRAVAEGAITPREGADLASIVQKHSAAIETEDLVKRIDALGAELRGFKG